MVYSDILKQKCNYCKEYIDIYSNNYKCNECIHFYICEVCRFSENTSHSHSLIRISAQLRDYPYYIKQTPKKTIKRHKLILGSFSSALPNSTTIKEHNIKAVLSLLHFDILKPSKELNNLNTLQNMFFKHGTYQSLIQDNNILYFHINIPDLEDPKQLLSYNCDDFFPKSILYIEYALRKGNVLVHCEKGQRRSPTIFLAWLLYHNYSLIESIDMISNNYEGDEDWGDSYKRRRNLWIDGPLEEWQNNIKRKKICQEWILSNKNLIKQWNINLFPPKLKTSSLLKKRKREDMQQKEKEESLIHPIKKKQKLTL